jgi:hypothetical protein
MFVLRAQTKNRTDNINRSHAQPGPESTLAPCHLDEGAKANANLEGISFAES